MLQFVLGIAGTGKTAELLRRIDERAQKGQRSIYLVPEQFSSSAEAILYTRLGDEKSAYAEVASFRTLAEGVLKAAGGENVRVLTDAARAVFVRRAIDALGPDVHTFVRQRRNTAFCALCAETIGELKTGGATPALLRRIAIEVKDDKFSELALIFEAYEAQIQHVAMDPQDRLSLAAQRADAAYFSGVHCFIDNFDGFTAPEYELLAQLLPLCDGMTAALCCDSLTEDAGGLSLFSPVRKAAQRLMEMARRADVGVKAPQVCQTIYRCQVAGPCAVNRLLAGLDEPDIPGAEGLYLTEYADEWEEARAVAAEMHRLAQKGVPYSRMAVVCRDIAQYESSVRRAMALFDIPLFVDAPSTIEYTAPVSFLRAALRLLQGGLASEPVLALLKSGLFEYTENEIAAVENYVYTWAPKAAAWRTAFDKNPAGLLAEFSGKAEKQLQLAEGVRARIVPLLEDFLRHARGQSAAGLSKQLYLLLDKAGAARHADAVVAGLEARGEMLLADKSRRAWDTAMGLLDQMTTLIGDEKLEAAEYDDILLLLVRATDFGQAPQMLECAIFTSADRMRLADPDYAFILGICEGEFPMQVGYSGLLTHADRDALVAGGIELPGSFENRTLLEEMFYYRALTAPRQGLYLSYPARRAGSPRQMASALEQLRLALSPPPLRLSAPVQAATPAAAYDLLAGQYRENSRQAASLYAALQRRQNTKDDTALQLLAQVDNGGRFRVRDKQALAGLLGNRLTISATKAQRYYECRFAYLMECVWDLYPRRKAEFSPLESGTFVHYVLEKVLEETGAGFAACKDEELAALSNRHADAFIAENLPENSRRTEHLLARIKENILRLLCYMRDAAVQSDFRVDALELPLADAPDAVPPLTLQTADGQEVRVVGKIDRVDTLQRDGKTYLSIIDYKTGGKAFSLKDVYCGLNMQMLLYMQTLLKNAGERYPGATPAAVLYLASDPAPISGNRRAAPAPLYKMDGLLLQNAGITRSLDRQGGGVFIPVRYNKNGSLRAAEKLADLEKIGNACNHVENLVLEMAEGVYGGQFPARPLVHSTGRPCDYCPYRAACRHEDGRNETLISAPKDVFAPQEGGADHA